MARPVLTRLREHAEVETTLDESPDQGDWYNQPAAWTAHGSDNLSGIDTCESDSYAGPDGDNRTVTGSCTDVAGHQASDESDPFKYDATAPEVAKLDSGPDNDPWYNQPVCRRLGALRLRRHRAEPESERDTEPAAAQRLGDRVTERDGQPVEDSVCLRLRGLPAGRQQRRLQHRPGRQGDPAEVSAWAATRA